MSELGGRFVVSLRGTTLMDLIRTGSELGFSCRPLRLELNELKALATPCILHWQMSHFVVLVLVVMLFYSVKLSFIVIAAILVYLLIRTIPHSIYHRLNDEALVHEAKAKSHFLESIRAVHTTKLAGLEEQRRARWLNLFVAGVNKRISAQKMTWDSLSAMDWWQQWSLLLFWGLVR